MSLQNKAAITAKRETMGVAMEPESQWAAVQLYVFGDESMFWQVILAF